MRQTFGETRSAFADKHAVISPDSHEQVTLPHWPGCRLVHLITPALGAEFTFFLARSQQETRIGAARADVERFVLHRAGGVAIDLEGAGPTDLPHEGYAFLPAGCQHALTLGAGSEILVLERRYRPMEGTPPPAPVVSSIPQVAAQPMKGDDRLMLQKLLPEGPGFDMEINVMNFSPGASLPYVETHFMEHGLMLLNGGGVYRLEDAWYPVAAGDAIWMGPYCPQWFGAIGPGNARYLIYKNWNRDPLG